MLAMQWSRAAQQLTRARFPVWITASILLMTGCAHQNELTIADDVLTEGGIVESRSAYAYAQRSPIRERAGESGVVSSPELCDNPTADMLLALKRDFARTLAACDARLHAFERRADQSRRTAAAIAIIGAIAGAVVVPALTAAATTAKSTVAAWSGVAGLSNLAQGALDDNGLNAATIVATREALRTDLLPYVQTYTSASSNYCDRVLAVSAIAAACVTYSVLNPQPSLRTSASGEQRADPNASNASAPDVPATDSNSPSTEPQVEVAPDSHADLTPEISPERE